jgi:Tfp pilus assembly protein PilN
MARSINLLPPELSPNKIYAAVGRKIKTISIVGYVLLIITITSSAIGFLIFSRRLETLTSKQNSLEQDLGNLKKTEATVVILKDRADKSKIIFDSDLTRASMESFNKFKSQAPQGVEFTELSIENKQILVSATSLNSTNLESFITYLISSGIFQKVRLTGMNLNGKGEYSMSFMMEI